MKIVLRTDSNSYREIFNGAPNTKNLFRRIDFNRRVKGE